RRPGRFADEAPPQSDRRSRRRTSANAHHACTVCRTRAQSNERRTAKRCRWSRSTRRLLAEAGGCAPRGELLARLHASALKVLLSREAAACETVHQRPCYCDD